MPKKRKTKPVKIHLMAGADLDAVGPLLRQVVSQWHPDLAEARIALLWRYDVRPDRDGHLELGRAGKASDLSRELAPDYDLTITLNYDAWQELTEAQRLALLDHECSHFALVLDEDGEPKRDQKQRLCYRLVKHDIGEFRSVVARHGCYLSDVEAFVKAAQGARGPGMFRVVNQ